MEWWDIIVLVVGIAGVAFAIFVSLRSKQVFRPAVTFSLGLLSANDNFGKALKKCTVTTLIYGASIPQGDEVAFVLPYKFMNNSKLPVSNLVLQLQYAAKYAIRNEERIRGVFIKGEKALVGELGCSPDGEKYREVQILDSMAQVRYTIPIMRPGEGIVIADTVKFANYSHPEQSYDSDYGISKKLAQELRKTKRVSDFCVVDIFIYSESCAPQTYRIKLLWFDTDSLKELSSLINDSIDVFWGGHFPKPGLYFYLSLPWKKRRPLIVEEDAEAIIPKLEVMQISEDTHLWFENPLESGRIMFTLKMPPWNYYQAPTSLSTDELILRSGFQSIVSKDRHKKLYGIFKRFGRV